MEAPAGPALRTAWGMCELLLLAAVGAAVMGSTTAGEAAAVAVGFLGLVVVVVAAVTGAVSPRQLLWRRQEV